MQGENEKLILEKLNSLLQEIEALKTGRAAPTRIPLKDFCTERNITRPTAYAWNERGLIKMERIGGRQFVALNSITIGNKYQRQSKE